MLPALVLATVTALDGGAEPAGPPPGLACLPKWYPVKAVKADAGWAMRLPDGTTVPYDDGKAKTPAELVESPDMEDTYGPPYRQGPIVPVTAENDGPGRVRYYPLLEAAYGSSKRQVDTVRVTFFGKHVMVHRRVLEPFNRVMARLDEAVKRDGSVLPFLQKVGGTFNWRKISDTDRRSAHSYGISIDLNVARSNYWEWQRPKAPLVWKNRFPQAVVDAFEAEGFIWGGRWDHYDTMHFEYRPELLDPACRGPASP